MSNDEHDPHAEEKLAKAKYDAEVSKPRPSDTEACAFNCTGSYDGLIDPECKMCRGFLAGVAHARKHPDPVLMACFRHMYSAIGKHLMNQNTANRWPDPGLKLARSKAAEYLEAKEGKA